MTTRTLTTIVSLCVTATLLALPAGADPAAAGPEELALQCAADAGNPEPGTPQFQARDAQNMACAYQRRAQAVQHPNYHYKLQNYGADPYRDISRNDGIRFTHDFLTIDGIEAEITMPCEPDTCVDVPEGVGVFDGGPYPTVVLFHGALSDKQQLWWASQPLAEEGYVAIAVQGTDGDIPERVLDWINGDGQQAYPGLMDTDRVGVTGHSLGAENVYRAQSDDRIAAAVSMDPCNSVVACENSAGSHIPDELANPKPTLYLTAEYTGWPQYPAPFTDIPGTLRLDGASSLRARGIDTMLLTLRASTHVDFLQGNTGGNNVWAESTSVYFTLAWFDRHLKGLALPTDTNAERAARQAIALDAFDRLTAETFDDSADRHNISMGQWDPVKAALSGDVMYGGNVAPTLDGMPVADRLSFYYRSICSLTVTDHADGSVLARADTTDEGSMRDDGCAVLLDGRS